MHTLVCLPQVQPDQPFLEAGLDSLGVVELRNKIQIRFEVKLPATITFDFPTPSSLARYLHQMSKAINDSATAANDEKVC